MKEEGEGREEEGLPEWEREGREEEGLLEREGERGMRRRRRPPKKYGFAGKRGSDLVFSKP